MITGSKESNLPPGEVFAQLKTLLASGNFEILEASPEKIEFRHGTYLTSSAPLLPKRGQFRIEPNEQGSKIDFEIEVSGFAKYWILFVGVLFCWLIFPPIFVQRALVHHPQQLIKNLLQAV